VELANASTSPATGPGGSVDVTHVEDVIRLQLQVLSQQLEVLNGGNIDS
jgi:hypothetical protein